MKRIKVLTMMTMMIVLSFGFFPSATTAATATTASSTTLPSFSAARRFVFLYHPKRPRQSQPRKLRYPKDCQKASIKNLPIGIYHYSPYQELKSLTTFCHFPTSHSRSIPSTKQFRRALTRIPYSTKTLLSQYDEAGVRESGTNIYCNNQNTFTVDREINSFQSLVDSMFSDSKCQVDMYWKEPLLQLTRQSARNLLFQLDVQQCPMGYDPLAQPYKNNVNQNLGFFAAQSMTNNDEEDGGNFSDDELDTITPRSISNSKNARRVTTQTSNAGKKGSFLAYCREQKQIYNDCIILTRCGDFYESFGIDAIMLVEHCGLNAMAGKAKAGCPIRNIQATLNYLTSVGYRVAVYEEGADTDSMKAGPGASGGSKARLKSRFLAQIVSPASPTYVYDLILSGRSRSNANFQEESSLTMIADELSTSPVARPYVGILSMQTGYTMVEVAAEERSVRVSEQLTAEAVACQLAAYPPTDPLIYVASWSEYELYHSSPHRWNSITSSLPFLPSRNDVSNSGPGSRMRISLIPPTIVQGPTPGLREDIRAKNVIVGELLKLTECKTQNEGCEGQRVAPVVTVDDYTLITMDSSNSDNDGRKTSLLPSENSYRQRLATATRTKPLYLETAIQLGLMNDNTIPALISYILPETAPAACRRFLRRYLLTPPPPLVATAMSSIIRYFAFPNNSNDHTSALPPFAVPPVGKVLSLLRAGQASAEIYSDLLKALYTTIIIVQQLQRCATSSTKVPSSVACEGDREYNNNNIASVDALMILLEYESGLAANSVSLQSRCLDAMKEIELVICEVHHMPHVTSHYNVFSSSGSTFKEEKSGTTKQYRKDTEADYNCDQVSDFGLIIPQSFLQRNEMTWRFRVQRRSMAEAYSRVEHASKELYNAIAADFWLLNEDIETAAVAAHNTAEIPTKTQILPVGTKNPVVYDVFNNLLLLRDIPPGISASAKGRYIHPKDRNGKILRNRYTTERVQDALVEYIDACCQASANVTIALKALSKKLHDNGHIPAIVQASHANLIVSSVYYHAIKSKSAGWNLVDMFDGDDEHDAQKCHNQENHPHSDFIGAGRFVGLRPYWIQNTKAIRNTFSLEGMFLLTAPNMSGKSTIMRSTAAAALLSACGLCAPLDSDSKVRRFDHIFVRGASSDVPVENKSAFGAEMGDVAALMRCCGSKSLVFVDELGRGTSPFDGTRLAGAILETMAVRGMCGMFSTHLHGILAIPTLIRDRIIPKRMAIIQSNDSTMFPSRKKWTYQLEDGICLDSMALSTAEQFGLQVEIIERAKSLSVPSDYPTTSLMESSASSNICITLNNSVVSIVEDVTAQSSILIPSNWSIPLALIGRSTVYVLQLNMISKKKNCPNEVASPMYYVGESDRLDYRIEQHRKKGGIWRNLLVVATVPASSKAQARTWERMIIQSCVANGHHVISTNDGR